jgi:FMN phosphatase YigB (HAD superfamily)
VDPARHVHVAASSFHDLGPAEQLEIPAVWINRLGEESPFPRTAELSDLNGLADALDGIISE